MPESTNGRNGTNLIIPLAVIFGMPVVAGVVWLLSGGTIPLQSLVVMAGVYVMALSWSVMHFLNARTMAASLATTQSTALVTMESMQVMQSWPMLDLVHSVAAQPSPRLIEVTAEIGICPRGFKSGDLITVGRDGTLSRPICRSAVAALNPALEAGAESGNGSEAQVSCLCPLPMRHLTFSIGREQVASLN